MEICFAKRTKEQRVSDSTTEKHDNESRAYWDTIRVSRNHVRESSPKHHWTGSTKTYTEGVIHYISNQPVIREDAESIKLRIVHDCSAKQNPQEPSSNDCLKTGPTLQPLLYDILILTEWSFTAALEISRKLSYGYKLLKKIAMLRELCGTTI